MKVTLQQVVYFGWIVTGIVLVALTVSHFGNIDRIERLEETNRQLAEQLHRAKNEVDENKPTRPIEVFSWDIEAMKRAGLKEPLKDIVSDLKRHRELIPYGGSLGGTMNFYGESKMWILTNKWVLAYFEDGHSGGYLLLEYDITKNEGIQWKILASYLS